MVLILPPTPTAPLLLPRNTARKLTPRCGFYSSSSSWLNLMEEEIHGARTTTHSQGCALRYFIPPSKAALPRHTCQRVPTWLPPRSHGPEKADPVETVETLSPKPGAEMSVGDSPLPQRRSPEDSGVCLQEKLTFLGHSSTTYLQKRHRYLSAKHTEEARPSQLRPPQCPNLQSRYMPGLWNAPVSVFPVSATSTCQTWCDSRVPYQDLCTEQGP